MVLFKKILVFLLMIVLFSCGEYPCIKADLKFNLIGFSDQESDTIILRRYQKNSTVLKDSFVFNPANAIRFARFGDTLFTIAYTSNALLQSDYDYQLFFPEARRMISITEINEVQSYSKKKGLFNNTKEGCVNSIVSCSVDAVLTSVIFPNQVYLRK